MEKPIVSRIDEELARPFVYDYCKRWGIPFDKDEQFEYGQAVLWVGAFYMGSLRAVIGLLVDDCMPEELYIYGFYGDNTVHEKRPIRSLVEFLFKMPYRRMYGFVHEKNEKMIKLWENYEGKVVESYYGATSEYRMLKMRGDLVYGRKIKPGSRRRRASSEEPNQPQ